MNLIKFVSKKGKEIAINTDKINFVKPYSKEKTNIYMINDKIITVDEDLTTVIGILRSYS